MRRLVFTAVVVLITGCADQTPVSPGPGVLANGIAAAHVYVGGTLVDGQVVRSAMGRTMFEARLSDPARRGDVRQVMMRYNIPGMGGSMMRRSGEQICYDDGSHGDDIAGDGIYHLMDEDDRMGCGRSDSPMGDYEYFFRCELNDGSHAGEVSVVVKRN
jgi:hypothetical protein